MSGLNGAAGHARLLRRLEATYLRLVAPPPAIPRPRLEVWQCEQGELEAVNQATGEVRPVAALEAALEAAPDAPGVITLLVRYVDDRAR